MNPHLLIWGQFAVCLVVIGYAGLYLIRYGDAIAARTGLSRSWIGVILVATVTSLPELVTGLSAVTIASSPGIAIGDVVGSCVFNLAILGLVGLLWRPESMPAVASRQHMLAAGWGAVLLVVAALVLPALGDLAVIGHVSWGSLLIVALYALAMRTLYLAEQGQPVEKAPAPGTMTLKSALTGYVFASIAIVGSGIWLPLIGVELAALMGWSDTLVGILFISLATSVPELATTLGAVRIGAMGMVLGNLLGSNLFDMLILAIDDFAYRPGNLYRQVSPMHALSALIACVMSVIVMLALPPRLSSRLPPLGRPAAAALLALYCLNVLLQFVAGG